MPTRKSKTETETVETPDMDATLTFEEVDELPASKRSGRPRTPTRFDSHVARLVPDSGKGLRFKVPTADLKKVRRELTSAGLVANPPVTVTMRVEESLDGETATVTIGAKPKITQKRKSANDSSE